MTNNNIDFGKVIKNLFDKHGYSAKDFSIKWGKSEQAVYDLFKKKDVNTSIIKMICTILKISLFDFFSTANNYSQTGRLNSFGDSNNIQYQPTNSPQNAGNNDNEKIIMQEKINSLLEQNRLLNKMIEMYEKQEKK